MPATTTRTNTRTASTAASKARSNRENIAPAPAPTAPRNDRARDRRPSAKVAAQIQAQQEAARVQAEADARRADRANKTQRRREKAIGIDTRADDDLEPRPDTVFSSRSVISKPAVLAKRSSRIPPAPAPTRNEPAPTSPVDDNTDEEDLRGRQPSRTDATSRRIITSESPSPQRSISPFEDTLEDDPLGDSHSRSPTPEQTIGHKRLRDDDSDDDAMMDLELDLDAGQAKAQKINMHGGRPKASDYDDVGKEVILAAGARYRCLISTGEGFPDSATEIGLVKEAWKLANDNSGLQAIALTPDIAKIIKARGSQIRGEVKTKAAPLVETMFGFESGQSRHVIKKNRTLAENLKHEKGYIYQAKDGTRKGIYQAPIIQKLVNAIWFKNKRDEGVVFPQTFNPLPVRAIALVLTALECCIDEWLPGVKTDVIFFADEYRPVYLGHIESLRSFGNVTREHDLLGRLQRRLYNYGRHHAGAPSIQLQNVAPIPISAFEAALKEYEADSATDDEGDMMAV